MKFWQEGVPIIFDDSYEHEACNLSEDKERVVLIFDIWHPDLQPNERQAIMDMFRNAKNT